MSSSLRDQLLKAGLVTKKQAQKAEKEVQKAYRNDQKQQTKRTQKKPVPAKPQVATANESDSAAKPAMADKAAPTSPKPLTPKQYYQQIRKEKELKDKTLNEKIVNDKKHKGLWAEVAQLIDAHRIAINANADIAHHFIVQKAVKTLYVELEQHKKLVSGKLAIVQSGERYHLVPLVVAKRIRERLSEAVVFLNESKEADHPDDDDPYKDYQVPDDLIW